MVAHISHAAIPRNALLVAVLATATLTACNYFVRRDEFDATVGELRAADARLDARLQSLAGDLQTLSRKYDAALSATEGGGLRIDTVAYFGTGDASLDKRTRQMLTDYARTIHTHRGNAIITVEGFADASGPSGFNARLGQRRADAVRDYLIEQGGLHPAQVQAVSYGEAENRQIIPGAVGRDGRENRRVSLVVDYAGPRMAAPKLSDNSRSARR